MKENETTEIAKGMFAFGTLNGIGLTCGMIIIFNSNFLFWEKLIVAGVLSFLMVIFLIANLVLCLIPISVSGRIFPATSPPILPGVLVIFAMILLVQWI